MSVHSNDSGGLHGHLTLSVTAAKYLTVAGVAFPAPVAPPANAVIPVGATAAIIGDTVRMTVIVYCLYRDLEELFGSKMPKENYLSPKNKHYTWIPCLGSKPTLGDRYLEEENVEHLE
jgi:hypothetical protein